MGPSLGIQLGLLEVSVQLKDTGSGGYRLMQIAAISPKIAVLALFEPRGA